MLVWLLGCATAAWWQVGRAADGNALSYMYAVEWPVFAILGVLGWWAVLHTERATDEETAARKLHEDQMRTNAVAARRSTKESEDPILAAYNDHLAHISHQPKKKLWGH